MRIGRAIFCGLLAAGLLTGCGNGTNSFTWNVETVPSNLDPQVAARSSDVIACTNLCGGLLRRTPFGELQPDACTGYTLSADGRTYTFFIREGLHYLGTKGSPTAYEITAEDFVFALRRVFRRETASPYSTAFASIAGAEAILRGEAEEETLGVTAPDPLTLVITLCAPDPAFPEKLTLPGAMPCDEAFFLSTKGTYGLTADSTLSSGSFYIYNWNQNGLFLRRTASPPLVDSLRLVEGSGSSASPLQRLISRKCDAVLDTGFAETGFRQTVYCDTTWALLLRDEGTLGDASLRQALAAPLYRSSILPHSAKYSPARSLIPDGLRVDGLDYRTLAGEVQPVLPDGREEYSRLRDALGSAPFKKLRILVPDEPEPVEAAQQISAVWQTELNLFLSIEAVDRQTYQQRLADGRYTLALACFTMEDENLAAFLGQTAAAAFAGEPDASLSALLQRAEQSAGEDKAAFLAKAERTLLASTTLVPLFHQNKRLLLADGVDNLVFQPFGPVLDATYTLKE